MTADTPQRVRIGVHLPVSGEIGAWLGEGAAFDAAGADALWVDLGASPELDPYVLVGALAAVTFRAELVVELATDPAADRPRVVPTMAAVSRGRLVLRAGPDSTGASNRGGWETVPVPDGRSAWRALLADAAERGVTGLIVAADPRLLDLLRNPDEEIDRRDLQLAQG